MIVNWGIKRSLFVILEQVGTQAARALQRLLHLPLGDFGLMAAQQDFGNMPAV